MTQSPLDIYLIAIGGSGMTPLACLLQEQGHRVRGSDGPIHPPMSTLLEQAGIRPHVGFDPAHLDPPPDLVVVGNAVPREHPEALATERLGIPRLSMPEALARFFLAGRRPLVVAGTHGKTTTSAMAAWVLEACAAAPGFLIGGVPLDLERSFAIGSGPRFVVEGDEYNAAYFDRGPKFFHYHPETLILTSVEHDHADLYPDSTALEEVFVRLVQGLPPAGLLIACGDQAKVRELARQAPCRVLLYGLEEGNDVRPLGPVDQQAARTRLRVAGPGEEPAELELALPGRHNVSNALAVWAAARADGLRAAAVADALGRFRGVRRRLEELGSAGGITVVEDFAHHPTAVASSLEALRQRYPGRRLVAIYEPRSLTAGRAFLFQAYCDAFARADEVVLAPLFHRDRLAPEERLDLPALARALSAAGVEAGCPGSVEEVLGRAVEAARPGDVVVTMSSGAFAEMPRKILVGLGERVAAS